MLGYAGIGSRDDYSIRWSAPIRSAGVLLLMCATLAFDPTALCAQTELRGRVTTQADGRPILGAQLLLPTLGRMAVSDTAGRYRFLEITPGRLLLVVRAPGYRPDSAHVTVGAAPVVRDVALAVLPTVLEEVTVSAPARAVPSKMRPFEERRAAGFGRFIDRDFLARNAHRKTGDVVAQQVPGVRIRRGQSKAWASNGRAVAPSGCAFCRVRADSVLDPADRAAGAVPACYMDVYVDGTLVYNSAAPGTPLFDLNSIAPDGIEGIEVYTGAGQIPVQYNRTAGGCGVMLIWTRVSS